jgi:hypothetical protein
MRHAAGGSGGTPGDQGATEHAASIMVGPEIFDTSASSTVNQAFHDTLERKSHIERVPAAPARAQSVGPISSGNEDAVGKTRRNRIRSSEKRALVLLASVSCHTHLKPRGKDRFWKDLVAMRVAEGGPETNWNTCKAFFLNQIKGRDREIEEDSTHGREIRHGEYFRHLDELRERLDMIEKAGKAKKKPTTEPAAAKELIRENPRRPYGHKRRAKSVVSLASGSERDEGDKRAMREIVDTGSVRASSSRATSCSHKRRRYDKTLSQSIGKLAEATENGASELAAVMRQATQTTAIQGMARTASGESTISNTQIREMVAGLREETAQRLDALERRAEEREVAREEREAAREVRDAARDARAETILQMLGQLIQGLP